jgi:hypothetical protein
MLVKSVSAKIMVLSLMLVGCGGAQSSGHIDDPTPAGEGNMMTSEEGESMYGAGAQTKGARSSDPNASGN